MPMRMEPHRHEDVHREPPGGDREHARARHHRRVVQPPPCLRQHERDDAAQDHPVHERGQDLGPIVAVRLLRARGTAADPEGEPREPERADVGEHVHRVGQQREAVGEPSADQLAHTERRGDREPRPDRPGLDGVVALAHARQSPP